MENNNGYWIGVRDVLVEGEWRWLNGHLARNDDITLWEPGEPNSIHGTKEDCAISFFGKSLDLNLGHLLHDISCTTREEQAICEKSTNFN